MDQEWNTIEIDERYLMDYLIFSKDPFIIAKNAKYCKKGPKSPRKWANVD
jgi:hypothetical protein